MSSEGVRRRAVLGEQLDLESLGKKHVSAMDLTEEEEEADGAEQAAKSWEEAGEAILTAARVQFSNVTRMGRQLAKKAEEAQATLSDTEKRKVWDEQVREAAQRIQQRVAESTETAHQNIVTALSDPAKVEEWTEQMQQHVSERAEMVRLTALTYVEQAKEQFEVEGWSELLSERAKITQQNILEMAEEAKASKWGEQVVEASGLMQQGVLQGAETARLNLATLTEQAKIDEWTKAMQQHVSEGAETARLNVATLTERLEVDEWAELVSEGTKSAQQNIQAMTEQAKASKWGEQVAEVSELVQLRVAEGADTARERFAQAQSMAQEKSQVASQKVAEAITTWSAENVSPEDAAFYVSSALESHFAQVSQAASEYFA